MWNLGAAPISDPVGLIEELGIFIQSADLGADDMYAICGKKIASKQYGMVINTNETVTIERQRFSIIHELAHLIAHRDDFCSDCNQTGVGRNKDPREIYADAFAGAFLVPAEELERILKIANGNGIYDISSLILQIKSHFRVSYLTLLLRLKSIGYFSSERQFGMLYGKLKKVYGATELQPITTALEFYNPVFFSADDTGGNVEF